MNSLFFNLFQPGVGSIFNYAFPVKLGDVADAVEWPKKISDESGPAEHGFSECTAAHIFGSKVPNWIESQPFSRGDVARTSFGSRGYQT